MTFWSMAVASAWYTYFLIWTCWVRSYSFYPIWTPFLDQGTEGETTVELEDKGVNCTKMENPVKEVNGVNFCISYYGNLD